MSRCRSCNAEIKWIRMKTGRSMPVDAKPISYRIAVPGATGTQTLVTPDGRTVSCFFDSDSDLKGYISHFATCLNAGQHRRR